MKKHSSRLRALAASVAIALVTPSAHAITTTVHDLISTRSGSLHFLDSFNDGIAPPSSPNFANGTPHTYFIGAGVIPAGAESGGKLTLDSLLGGATTGAGGTPSLTQRITVQSNSDPTNTINGLKPNFSFAASALVDIAGATGPGAIQLRLVDRTTPTLTTGSTITEMVSIDFIASNSSVRFRRQDFVAGNIQTFSTIAIPVPADQVRLMLLHPNENVDQVFAAAEFFDDGQSLGVYSLPGSSPIFTYRDFTRMELAAAQNAPIPEPGAYAMMLVGTGLIGLRLRRRARAGQTQRLA